MDEDECDQFVSLEKLVRCDECSESSSEDSHGYYKLRSRGKGKRRSTSKLLRPRRRPSQIIAPAGCMFDREDGVPPQLRRLGLCECDLTPRVPLESMGPVVARCLQEDRAIVLSAYAEFLRAIGVNPRGRARCVQEIDAIHDAFFDWFAYDYTYADGVTVLEKFLMENAAGVHQLTHERVKALWSVLNCSIEGAFLVERVMAFARLTMLRSLKDGFKLYVEDSMLSMSLLGCENTFIAGRFTQFGPVWRPSARPFHIPTPYRSVVPGAIDDLTAVRVRAQRSQQRMSRRRALGSFAMRGTHGTLFAGVPDAFVPDPVNSASLEWFMASGTFDISQFVPMMPVDVEDDIESIEGTGGDGSNNRKSKRGKGTRKASADVGTGENVEGGGIHSRSDTVRENTVREGAVREGTAKGETVRGNTAKRNATRGRKNGRAREKTGNCDKPLSDCDTFDCDEYVDLTYRMPLADCRNSHGHICDAEDHVIAGMSYLQLLGMVFCAPGEEPYDQHGYESRDYMMICNELFDMGIMV